MWMTGAKFGKGCVLAIGTAAAVDGSTVSRMHGAECGEHSGT